MPTKVKNGKIENVEKNKLKSINQSVIREEIHDHEGNVVYVKHIQIAVPVFSRSTFAPIE